MANKTMGSLDGFMAVAAFAGLGIILAGAAIWFGLEMSGILQ
jgi:hypothetical protein